jgi:hypothetical protein
MHNAKAIPLPATTETPAALARRLKRLNQQGPIVPKTVKPRIRRAIDAMVHQGMDRRSAALSVGLHDKTLYKAFQVPDVLRYYNGQLDVLRNSEKARNLHRGIELREKAESEKVALDAAKWLHGESDRGVNINLGVGVQVQPGYMVDVSRYSTAAKDLLAASGSSKSVQNVQDVGDENGVE